MQRIWRQVVRFLFLLLLIMGNVLVLTKILLLTRPFETSVVLQDFVYYMQSIHDIQQGINPYTASHTTTLGPPVVFLFFWPFALLPLSIAQGLFVAVSILCGIGTCVLLAKLFPQYSQLRLSLLSSLLYFLSFPVRFSLSMGQPNLIFGLIVAVSLTHSLPLWRGIGNALLLLTKPIYVPVLVSLHRKSLGLTLILLGMALLLLSQLFAPAWIERYLQQQFVPVIMSTAKPVGLDYYNQSLHSTMARLQLISLYPGTYLLLLFAGVFVLLKTRSYAWAIVISLLLSPVVWQHYLVVLLPILVWLGAKGSSPKRWWAIGAIYLLLWKDYPWLHIAEPTLATGLLASHWFFAVALSTVLILLHLYRESSGKRFH